MHVASASFIVFLGRNSGVAHIEWELNCSKITVSIGDDVFPIDNTADEWKPCATHAMDLVRINLKRKPSCNQAKQRARKITPLLRLVSDAVV